MQAAPSRGQALSSAEQKGHSHVPHSPFLASVNMHGLGAVRPYWGLLVRAWGPAGSLVYHVLSEEAGTKNSELLRQRLTSQEASEDGT